MNLSKVVALIAFGFVVGVISGLSFLRTQWGSFNIDFFFWWSIVSTLFGLGFAGVSIWQYWESKSQIRKNNAQVKVWMQDANGIRQALQRIVRDNIDGRFTTTNDMGNAVWGVEANAGALYQSLYEERCVTEQEYKARQKTLADLLDKKQFLEIGNEIKALEAPEKSVA